MGTLDYSALSPSGITGRVTVYSQSQESDARGRLLVSSEPETIVTPDAKGAFEVRGLRPGRKKISAVWHNDKGTYCVANRVIQVDEIGEHDLGLLQPNAGSEIKLRFQFRSTTGELLQWHELFGQDSQVGKLTILVKNDERLANSQHRFWDAIYPRFDEQLTIRGLTPGKWKLHVMKGSGSSTWPIPARGEKLRVAYDSELVFETFEPVDEVIYFEVDKLQMRVLELLPAAALGGLNKVELKVDIHPEQGGSKLTRTVEFERQNGVLRGKTTIETFPSIAILRSKPSASHEVCGWARLSEESDGGNGTSRIQVGEGVLVSGRIDKALLMQMRSGVLKFDVAGWPIMEDAHFVAIPDKEGVFQFGPMPASGVVYERSTARQYVLDGNRLEMSE